MNETAEVAVVGGGIAGLGVAWALAERGRRVVVFEGDRVGGGASWAAAGMLAPTAELGFEEFDLFALSTESLRRWPAFAARLEAASGADLGYRDAGTLVVADDRDSARALRRLYDFQTRHGANATWLSGDDARDLEPLLSPRLPAAIHSPDDHQVDNRALVNALVEACRRSGVEIREAAPVAAIVPDAEAPTVRLGNGAEIRARAVVLAAGAWSAGVGGLAPAPPVRPVKGQAMSLRMTPGVRLAHTVRGPDAYLVPKADGRLVVGATSEDGVTSGDVTAGGLYRLLEGAVEIVPGVEELAVEETWAAFRPASRDHAPLLGQSAHDGVFFATGHYRHGVLLAPATSEEVAAEVDRALAGAPAVADVLAPFSPRRFSA